MEPVLNAWASRLLGDPRKARCIVEQLDDATGKVKQTHEVKLSELGLTPLDVVFSVDAQPRTGSLTDLEQTVLMFVRRKVAQLTDTTRLQLAVNRPSDWSAKDLLLQDVVDQARSVRRVLSRSRSLDANDLDLPSATWRSVSISPSSATAPVMRRPHWRRCKTCLKRRSQKARMPMPKVYAR